MIWEYFWICFFLAGVLRGLVDWARWMRSMPMFCQFRYSAFLIISPYTPYSIIFPTAVPNQKVVPSNSHSKSELMHPSTPFPVIIRNSMSVSKEKLYYPPETKDICGSYLLAMLH